MQSKITTIHNYSLLKFVFQTSFLNNFSSAGWTNIKTQLNSLITAQNSSQSRTISRIDIGLLDRYGCWCFFEDDHSRGRGAPVNEIDQLCKVLHDGYTCTAVLNEIFT